MDYYRTVCKFLACLMTIVLFTTQCLWAHKTETTLWAERTRMKEKTSSTPTLLAFAQTSSVLPMPLDSSLLSKGFSATTHRFGNQSPQLNSVISALSGSFGS